MLVVAQDNAVREQLGDWIVQLGFEAASASSAASAWRIWQGLGPAAVIVARIGPATAARRLAKRLRGAERQSQMTTCTLIAATGYADDRDYEAYRAAGFDAVLTLPLRFAGLASRMAAAGLSNQATSGHMLESRAEAEALFTHELSEDIEHLAIAVAAGSAADIGRWAHRIKGASLMFGKDELGQVAALIEGEQCGHPPADPAVLSQLMQRLKALAHDATGGSASASAEGAAGPDEGASGSASGGASGNAA